MSKFYMNTVLSFLLLFNGINFFQEKEVVVHTVEVERIVTIETDRILNHGLLESDIYEVVYNTMLYLGEENPRDFTALLLATARAESGFTYLKQTHGGPARSVFQIEPETEKDVHENFLKYNKEIREKVEALMFDEVPGLDNLTSNIPYATAIAYSCYKRYMDIPPSKDDKQAQAETHKKVYNRTGKATVEKTMAKL